MRPNVFWPAAWVRALFLEALWLALPVLVSARGLRVRRGGGAFRCH